MTEPAPHDVLGIPADSSREDIERAYRRLSRKIHPDRGGDADEFNEMQAAYDKLTGRVTHVDKGLECAQQLLGGAYASAVEHAIQSGVSVTNTDIVAVMRGLLERELKQHRDELAKLQEGSDIIDETRKRLTADVADGERDLVAEIISTLLGNNARVRDQLTIQIAAHERALGILKKYKYRFKAKSSGGLSASVTATSIYFTN